MSEFQPCELENKTRTVIYAVCVGDNLKPEVYAFVAPAEMSEVYIIKALCSALRHLSSTLHALSLTRELRLDKKPSRFL